MARPDVPGRCCSCHAMATRINFAGVRRGLPPVVAVDAASRLRIKSTVSRSLRADYQGRVSTRRASPVSRMAWAAVAAEDFAMNIILLLIAVAAIEAVHLVLRTDDPVGAELDRFRAESEQAALRTPLLPHPHSF